MNPTASFGPVQAVHAGVLPLDRDRAGVADRVERAERVLPRHVAVPGRDEVPPAAGVAPRQVRSEHAGPAVGRTHPGVLAVDVVDAVLEVRDEPDRVDVLPHHVRRIPVEPERLTVIDRLERAHRSSSSRRRSRRVHLVREPHALAVEHVEDRVPAVREVLVARVDHRRRHRREHRHVRPDRRPGEADDGVDAELACDPRRSLHVVGGALPHALGVAVAPRVRAQDRLVPEVDRVVAHGLPGEVVRDRVHLEPVALAGSRGARRGSPAPRRRASGRGGRPSRRSRARRSPTRRRDVRPPRAGGRPTGR